MVEYFIYKFIAPRSKNEDSLRQEFILNILLVVSIFVIFVAIAINVVHWLSPIITTETYRNDALPITALVVIFSFFCFLYFLSRKGFFRLASYLLLGSFFLLATYMGYRWGVDSHAANLFFILIIVMAGVSIDTRFAFKTLIASSLFTLIIGYFQVNNFLHPNLYWKNENLKMTDAVMFVVIFTIIATVSWLSNREIEKSLMRARRSEADLKKERDLLEITVEDRTKELKETQAEKITQLYRFAEFGRLSSGLFHDLVSPLTAVSLNIEKLQSRHADNETGYDSQPTGTNPATEASEYVERAVRATKKLDSLVASVRKQLARQENKKTFSLQEEINDVIEVLSHKAQKARVTIHFPAGSDIKIFGDDIKFNQIALNLITNAIDACSSSRMRQPVAADCDIDIFLKQADGSIIFSVKDRGVGISDENKQKIFEPFFTTKIDIGGIGIGLSMTKRIVEKDFGGSIEMKSKENQGSEFVVRFPVSS